MPDESGGWFRIPHALIRGRHLAAMSGAELKVYIAIRQIENEGPAHPGLKLLCELTGLSRKHVIDTLRALTTAGYLVQERRGTVHKDASEYRSDENRLNTDVPTGVKTTLVKKGNQSLVKLLHPDKTVLRNTLPAHTRTRGADLRGELLASLREFQIPQAAKALALDAHLLDAWAEAIVNQCHDDIQFRRYYTAQRFQAFFTSLRGKDAGIVAATLNDQLAAIENGVVFAQPFARATETIKAGGPEMRTGNLRTRRDEPQKVTSVW